MYTSTAILAVAAGLTSIVSAVPEGCVKDYPGYFDFNPYKVSGTPTTKVKRQGSLPACAPLPGQSNGAPLINLRGNGVLSDQLNRLADIVANKQFQFDPKPSGQAGEIEIDNFSLCANNSIAHEDSAIFYSCNSGGFNNIYAESIASYCEPIYIVAEPCTPSAEELAAMSSATAASPGTGSATEAASQSAVNLMSMAGPASSYAASTPASASATPSSTLSTAVVASTGTGSPSSGTNGTVSTATSPSSTSSPKAFTGAADSLTVGSGFALLVLGFAGVALL